MEVSQLPETKKSTKTNELGLPINQDKKETNDPKVVNNNPKALYNN